MVRAQQDVESARATLVTGDETLRQSRESLGLALGLPQAIGVQPDIKMDELEKSALSSCQGRPFHRGARRHHGLAQAEGGGRPQRRRRQIPILPHHQLPERVELDHPRHRRLTQYDLETSKGYCPVPLWEGGARYGLLRSARVDFDESEQNLEASDARR